MISTRALASLATLTLAVAAAASACNPVDLGGDPGSGGDASSRGTGGGEAATGGGDSVPTGSGGDSAGTGGGESTPTGTGGNSGSGGGSAIACPTTVAGALTSYTLAPYEPAGVAIEPGAIYWTALAQGVDAGAVLKTDLASGTTVALATAALDPAIPSSSFDYPAGLALVGADVLWTAGAGGEVVRVPKSGGAATTLFHDGSSLHQEGTGTSPHTFAVDASNVYWNDITRSGNIVTSLILAMPLAGGPTTTLVTTSADILDQQAPPYLPLSIRADGATAFYVLWTGATSASVTRRVGIDGQNGADLFPGGYFVALDGVDLFAAADDFVVSMSEAGQNQTLVSGSTNTDMIATYQGIVEHAGYLYLTSYGSWSDGQSLVQGCGWVKKVPKTGGAATVLWAGKGRPLDIAVDDGSVTWSDYDNKSVMRLVP